MVYVGDFGRTEALGRLVDMEQSIVNYISEAEQQAAEIKSQGAKEAGEILARAEELAQDIARDTEANLAKYRETSFARAEEKACEDYDAQIAACRKEAANYADSLLKDTEVYVIGIIGRTAK